MGALDALVLVPQVLGERREALVEPDVGPRLDLPAHTHRLSAATPAGLRWRTRPSDPVGPRGDAAARPGRVTGAAMAAPVIDGSDSCNAGGPRRGRSLRSRLRQWAARRSVIVLVVVLVFPAASVALMTADTFRLLRLLSSFLVALLSSAYRLGLAALDVDGLAGHGLVAVLELQRDRAALLGRRAADGEADGALLGRPQRLRRRASPRAWSCRWSSRRMPGCPAVPPRGRCRPPGRHRRRRCRCSAHGVDVVVDRDTVEARASVAVSAALYGCIAAGRALDRPVAAAWGCDQLASGVGVLPVRVWIDGHGADGAARSSAPHVMSGSRARVEHARHEVAGRGCTGAPTGRASPP